MRLRRSVLAVTDVCRAVEPPLVTYPDGRSAGLPPPIQRRCGRAGRRRCISPDSPRSAGQVLPGEPHRGRKEDRADARPADPQRSGARRRPARGHLDRASCTAGSSGWTPQRTCRHAARSTSTAPPSCPGCTTPTSTPPPTARRCSPSTCPATTGLARRPRRRRRSRSRPGRPGLGHRQRLRPRAGPDEHPTPHDLDAAAGGRPVWLTHFSGHRCVLSSAALAQVGITAGRAPDGRGRIGVDRDGALTGVAGGVGDGPRQGPCRTRIPGGPGPRPSTSRPGSTPRRASPRSSTLASDRPGVDHSPLELAAYQLARETGRLHVRGQLMVHDAVLHDVAGHARRRDHRGLDLGVRTGFGDGWLEVGALKIWVDGAGGGDDLDDDRRSCGARSCRVRGPVGRSPRTRWVSWPSTSCWTPWTEATPEAAGLRAPAPHRARRLAASRSGRAPGDAPAWRWRTSPPSSPPSGTGWARPRATPDGEPPPAAEPAGGGRRRGRQLRPSRRARFAARRHAGDGRAAHRERRPPGAVRVRRCAHGAARLHPRRRPRGGSCAPFRSVAAGVRRRPGRARRRPHQRRHGAIRDIEVLGTLVGGELVHDPRGLFGGDS